MMGLQKVFLQSQEVRKIKGLQGQI